MKKWFTHFRVEGSRLLGVIFTSALFSAVQEAKALEVTANQAALAVEGWFSQTVGLSEFGIDAVRVAKVETATDEDGDPLFHVIRLEDGSTVVTSTDTGIEPIIAFGSDDFDVSERSPIHALLSADMQTRRAALVDETTETSNMKAVIPKTVNGATVAGETPESKWKRLLSADPDSGSISPQGDVRRSKAKASPVSEPATVMVRPLIGTQWDQGGAVGRDGDKVLHGKNMSPFSAFTPHNYPAGCGPVALAQILAYWNSFDLDEVFLKATYPVNVVEENGVTNTLFRKLYCSESKYNGAALPFRCVTYFPQQLVEHPFDPGRWTKSFHAEHQTAVGRLLADCGILLGVCYSTNATSTNPERIAEVLKEKFQYQAAKLDLIGPNDTSLPLALTQTQVDLDNGCPVVFGIKSSVRLSGHAVIADGYGRTEATYYYHLNMGWAGACDFWYSPPNFDTGTQLTYDIFEAFIHDIKPPNFSEETTLDNGTVVGGNSAPCHANPSYGFVGAPIKIKWLPYVEGATYTLERSQENCGSSGLTS